MRILQVHTRYRYSGGEDKVVDSEARLLERAGHEVCQYVERNPNSHVQAVARLAVSPWNPGSLRRVREKVAAFQPDVAHVHNTWFSISPSVVSALKAEGVPVVLTLHNYRLVCSNALLFRDGSPCTLCVGSHPWHAVRYGCYRGSRLQSIPAAGTIALNRWLGTWTQKVDMFLALTEFQRNLMIRAGLPEDKVLVEPNFVTDPGPRAVPPSESRTVLYVGRLSNEKGVDLLIEAWRKADPNLKLVVIGDGPDKPEVDAKPPTVQFLGRLKAEEVRRLMLEARAGVLPSRWYEGLPMTMLEFFAAGTPVLTSDIGSIGAIGSKVGAEWTVSEGPRSWISALQRLLVDTTVDEGGRAARSLYEDNFSPEKHRDSLLATYRQVAASGPRARSS